LALDIGGLYFALLGYTTPPLNVYKVGIVSTPILYQPNTSLLHVFSIHNHMDKLGIIVALYHLSMFCFEIPLSKICFSTGISDPKFAIQTSGDVVASLTQVLINEENETGKQTAAEILEHICTRYTKDDKYLGELEKAILESKTCQLCKDACKMVISMMKYYNDGFFKQEDFRSLMKALSRASDYMMDLEYSMVCSSVSSSETILKLDRLTLISLMSLVREEEELLASGVPSACLFQWRNCNHV
ncbi:hypothetical protein ZWY2020_045691, partial [Hordeum vulgare]